MTVLIPTDFSESSENAIRYALEYFSEIPVKFYLLHIPLDDFSQRPNTPALELNSPVEDRKITNLQEQLAGCKLLGKNPEHRFMALFEKGLLVEAIRKQVAEKEVDFIIMGTNGALKANRNEIGSNTWEVITKVKCPVLVIPVNAKFKTLTNISFLTDYNCIYRNKIISTLSESLQLHKAALRVLHIRLQNLQLTTAQTDNKGFLHYFFKETKHSFHFLDSKNIESGVQDFVKTWEIDLIAVVAKNLNLMQRLLFKPNDHSKPFPCQVPFLILHE